MTTNEAQTQEIERKEEKTNGEKILYKLFEIIGGILGLFIVYSLWNNYSQETSLYKEIYKQAETSLRKDMKNTSDVTLSEYDRDRITEQGVTICDFGEGNLKYKIYNVNIHVSDDDQNEFSPNIKVYYYDNEQDAGEGVDPTVQSHYYTIGILDSIRNAYNEWEQKGYEAIDQWESDMTN